VSTATATTEELLSRILCNSYKDFFQGAERHLFL
jgi:hypothetical protein